MPAQLTLDGFEDAVAVALDRIRSEALPHPNHVTFVREVAAKVLGTRRGSVVLCAAPVGISCDELIREIEDELTVQSEAATGCPFPGLSVVSVPSPLRRARGVAPLLDAYHEAAGSDLAQYRRPPEFQLEFGAVAHRSPFYETSSMLRTRGTAVYVWKNAHWLQPVGGPIEEAIDALATLGEIAEQSKRTQVLIGHTFTVLQWLQCAEIAQHVTPCFLAPYNLAKEVDAAGFLAVLAAYDSIVPWADGEALQRHISDIDRVVNGSPHRIRKWLIEALCKANAEREHSLSWSRFWSSQLLATECAEAKRERDLYSSIIARTTAESIAVDVIEPRKTKRKKQRNPGFPKPNRNGVAA